jgi:hypothetical protein
MAPLLDNANYLVDGSLLLTLLVELVDTCSNDLVSHTSKLSLPCVYGVNCTGSNMCIATSCHCHVYMVLTVLVAICVSPPLVIVMCIQY